MHEVINFVEDNGIVVISLTIDGWPHENSMEMCRKLGANICDTDDAQTHFLSLNLNKVYILFEAVCMITLLRNTLAYRGILSDDENQQIRWDLIQKLHKHQNLRGLHCNLTKEHMNFNSDSNNTTLAVETMNRDVGAAIRALNQHPKISDRLSNVEPTAKYLCALSDLLDAFHSKSEIHANAADGHPAFETFDATIEYIRKFKCVANSSGRKQTAAVTQGRDLAVAELQATVRSLRDIHEEFVVQKKILHSVVPEKFSNQRIETFFVSLKRKGHGDFEKSATGLQLVESYRRLLLLKCINKKARNATGQRVIVCNDVFDDNDNPFKEVEVANQKSLDLSFDLP